MPTYYGVAPGVRTRALGRDIGAEWERISRAPGHQEMPASARTAAFEAAAINEALRFLDPTSRGQMMRQLSQMYPRTFRGYVTAPVPTPPVGAGVQPYVDELLAQQRLNQAVKALAPEAVSQALHGHTKGVFEPSLNFLQDYLRTAQQAYGGGVARQSRAERQYAERRLGELKELRPDFGAMAQLGEALVSPVLARAPASGGLGTQRAVTGIPGERRGGAARNPWLT